MSTNENNEEALNSIGPFKILYGIVVACTYEVY